MKTPKAAANVFAAAVLLCVAASALAAVHYVDMNSTNATPPYTNWATGASNIQDAVDAAVAGDEIIVTNGTYAAAGRDGNRVKVDKPLSLRSLNGPQLTIISGGSASRCAYLTNGASLSGFTLSEGFSDSFPGGGGVMGGVVSNCVVASCRVVFGDGGGAWGCALNNCTLSDNTVYYAQNGTDSHGGGAALCRLNNCTLAQNSASSHYDNGSARGGGAYKCTLNNCTLIGNSATQTGFPGNPNNTAYGGGADQCTLNNCTLVGNSVNAPFPYGDAFGGGASAGTLNNCIVYFNVGGADIDLASFHHCCTPQTYPTGGNISNAPLFVDTNGWANLRLQSNSPCINAGNNAYAVGTTDLDGNPRIAGGTVDIGAYEFQSPVSMISYAWLQQYGLPINSSTDTADPDCDGVDNYHEWLAGTDPTNPLSSPAQLTITPSGAPPGGIILSWSTNAVGFTLQSTTNLLSSADWVTNSPAPVVVNGLSTVTNPVSNPRQFFRLLK